MPNTSFDQISLKLRIGDTALVTDASGRKQKGKVLDLSPQAISLLVKGTRRDMKAGDIAAIDLQRGDSLKNGALIGFGVGAGFGALTMVGLWAMDGEGTEGLAPAAVISGLFYGGIGAAIGAGVDAMIDERMPVYRAAGKSVAARISVAPLIGRHKKGVAVAIRLAQ